MSEITLSDLRIQLSKHRIWLSSGRLRGERINLKKANLCELTLNDASFCDGDLECVDLGLSCLTNIDFTGTNLVAAMLSGSEIRNATFVGADMSRAILNSADMGYNNMNNAIMRGTVCRFTNFRGADLRNADLTGAIMSGSDLRDAKIGPELLKAKRLRLCRLSWSACCWVTNHEDFKEITFE